MAFVVRGAFLTSRIPILQAEQAFYLFIFILNEFSRKMGFLIVAHIRYTENSVWLLIVE